MRSPPSQPNIDYASSHPAWSLKFWLLVVATGVAAGLAGGALMWLLHAVEHLAWNYRTGDLLQAASRVSPAHCVLMLTAAGVVVGAGGRLVRKLTGKPTEVNKAIWFHSGAIRFGATLAQAVHSIVIVGMGTSLGRESPIKQAGGALASRIAAWGNLSRAEQRLLVACGVGAGMAAAYNVPVGGALFAIEVLLGSMTLRMVMPALLCSGVATVASWVFLPTGSIYQVPEYPVSAQLTVWAIAAGPLLGVATVPLVRLIGWADEHKPQRLIPALAAPPLTLALLGAAAIWFPHLLGNGKDTVQLAYVDELSLMLLLVLPALKLAATAASLGCGASGGLFTPTMTIGAVLGGLLGHAWNHVWPGASMGSCAVIGSCAFLAAATHGPVSSLVMVLELTRHIDTTMAPMLLAVVGATLVVRRIEPRSIYSVRLHLEKVYGDARSDQRLLLPADDHRVSAATAYPDIAAALLQEADEPRAALQVVDERGQAVGRITAESLAALNALPMPLDAAKAADIMTTDARPAAISPARESAAYEK